MCARGVRDTGSGCGSMLRPALGFFRRQFSCFPEQEVRNVKVAVIGAASRVGQLVSLILKQQSQHVQELALSDTNPKVRDVYEDLRAVDTKPRVSLHELPEAIKDCNVIVYCAGESHSCDQRSNELFLSNAEPVFQFATQYAAVNPRALLAVVTQPVESLVPLVCSVMRHHKVLHSSRVFGVSAPDVMRASTMVARQVGCEPESFIVPVVGGHKPRTMVPVFSQTKPCMQLPPDTQQLLVEAVRGASDQVLRLNSGFHTPFITPAVAAARFTTCLIRGLRGEPAVVQCAYVASRALPGATFLCVPVQLGEYGVTRDYGLPRMTQAESAHLLDALEEIKSNICLGEAFAKKKLQEMERTACR